MEELQLVPIVMISRLQMTQHIGVDDARQEIIHYDILVMESHELLNFFERDSGILRQGAVVKSQEESLELRNNGVLVVAGISDERTVWVGVIAR